MFSLPTIMAGAWFINSVIVLFVVCFFANSDNKCNARSC
ncbi:aromatic amino acid transport family protein [Providencia sp. PROV272]